MTIKKRMMKTYIPNKGRKPSLMKQYDAQPRTIKRLIVTRGAMSLKEMFLLLTIFPQA